MALEVPNRYLALSPIIVTAPTARCGTTLVQRLLSASGNCFLYGEEVGGQLQALTESFVELIKRYEQTGAATDADFARAVAGVLNDWRPGLIPPTSVVLKAWVEIYYQLPSTLADYGQSIGRPLWGFKRPNFSCDLLRAILMLLPRTKVIYVYRDLYDVLKSAKARRFVVSEAEVTAFCATWAANMSQTMALRRDGRFYFLRYEDLVAHRREQVQRLERFTGARKIEDRVFATRVNTFAGAQSDGHSPNQYIEPAPLTATEQAIAEREAGAVMAQFYGADAARHG
jgi:hypothetical protein